MEKHPIKHNSANDGNVLLAADVNPRKSNIDKLIHEAQLLAACDTVDKWRFVKGEINLNEYLIREAMFNEIK